MVDLSSILEDLRGPGRWGGGCGASQADGAAGGAQETVRKGWKGSSYQMRRGPWGPLLWVETLGDSGSGPCRTLVSSSDLDRLSPALAGHGPSSWTQRLSFKANSSTLMPPPPGSLPSPSSECPHNFLYPSLLFPGRIRHSLGTGMVQSSTAPSKGARGGGSR